MLSASYATISSWQPNYDENSHISHHMLDVIKLAGTNLPGKIRYIGNVMLPLGNEIKWLIMSQSSHHQIHMDDGTSMG